MMGRGLITDRLLGAAVGEGGSSNGDSNSDILSHLVNPEKQSIVRSRRELWVLIGDDHGYVLMQEFGLYSKIEHTRWVF